LPTAQRAQLTLLLWIVFPHPGQTFSVRCTTGGTISEDAPFASRRHALAKNMVKHFPKSVLEISTHVGSPQDLDGHVHTELGTFALRQMLTLRKLPDCSNPGIFYVVG
jgi:hypothetical protein